MERLSREEIKRFLAEETLFRGASPPALDRLSALVRQKVVPEGCALFSMGQDCEALYFIGDGCGHLVKTAPDGRQRFLHRAVPGDMVAAVPFFDGKGFPASFVAESECLVLSFPRDELLALLGEDPSVSLSIIGGLVERLRRTVAIVEKMSFEDTARRLWDYLVQGSASTDDSDASGYPRVFESLPTRENIAKTIGTVREVVSRRLSKLVDSGHVKVERKRLVLLKPLEG